MTGLVLFRAGRALVLAVLSERTPRPVPVRLARESATERPAG